MDNKTDFFLSLLAKFGWLGNWLFLFIALIECIPIAGGFFPGGTLISIASFFAAQGYFNIWDVIIFATIGAVIGDYSGYALGRWGSGWLIKKNIIKPGLIDKGEDFFKRHGNKSIFWGRFIGATRAVIPFVAGTSRMKPRSFFLWNAIGSIFWAFFNAGLGYFSGNIIAVIIQKGSNRLAIIVGIILFILAVYWLFHKKRESIRDYFAKKSQEFTKKVFARNEVKKLTDRQPVITELFQTQASQQLIFAEFLAAIVLLLLYILALILDMI